MVSPLDEYGRMEDCVMTGRWKARTRRMLLLALMADMLLVVKVKGIFYCVNEAGLFVPMLNMSSRIKPRLHFNDACPKQVTSYLHVFPRLGSKSGAEKLPQSLDR